MGMTEQHGKMMVAIMKSALRHHLAEQGIVVRHRGTLLGTNEDAEEMAQRQQAIDEVIAETDFIRIANAARDRGVEMLAAAYGVPVDEPEEGC